MTGMNSASPTMDRLQKLRMEFNGSNNSDHSRYTMYCGDASGRVDKGRGGKCKELAHLEFH